MNYQNQLKWTFSRKTSFQSLKKHIYFPQRINPKPILTPKPNSTFVKNSIISLVEISRKHLIYYLSKSIKLIFQICLASFCLKFVFYHLRQHQKAYIRDLSYMQTYGYARHSDYEPLMNAKNSYEFDIFPYSFFHSVKYNQKDPAYSFLNIFNKYIYHPEFENQLGNFILMLWKYEPLKPPKNDFISILINDYINGEDFLDSLIRVLKVWLLNDDFKRVLLQKVLDALFSDKVLFGLLDALINEFFILLELPEVKEIRKELTEHYSKPENSKDNAFDMSDPVKVKSALKAIKKDKVFYIDSLAYNDYFKLTDYNKFYLRTVYDFFLEDPDHPIIDFIYYENPIFKYAKNTDELLGEERKYD